MEFHWILGRYENYDFIFAGFCLKRKEIVDCLCWGFTAQSTQWGHVERGQFT